MLKSKKRHKDQDIHTYEHIEDTSNLQSNGSKFQTGRHGVLVGGAKSTNHWNLEMTETENRDGQGKQTAQKRGSRIN